MRSYIEQKMVDYGLEFNDKLSAEFVSEVLDTEFFGRLSKSAKLEKTWLYNLGNLKEEPYEKNEVVKLLKRVVLSKDWVKMT